jgi:ATPase subunit of ABC transporter with duplicated ATPase domains
MVVATHDRYLLERLATRILTVDDRAVSDFKGTYHELRARRAREAAQAASRPAARATKAGRKTGGPPPPSKPTFDEVAVQIEAAESDLRDAAGWLGDPELYRDPDRAKAMRRRYEDAERKLNELQATLDTLEDTLDIEPPRSQES